MTPSLSFVVPAYNAERTIGETLDSLRAQSRGDWEAIVVDDGSIDGTAAVVAEAARDDPRIRLIRAPNARVSRARNAGLAQARADWVAFLDAGDWLSPRFADQMLAVAAAAGTDFVTCGYRRQTSDGAGCIDFFDPWLGENSFERLARGCALSTNSLIVRRALVTDLGGFDPALAVCEDWDLWQRAARTGATFHGLPETLAFCRMAPGWLVRDHRQMLADGLTVLRRGHRPDPRVASPLPQNVAGADPAQLRRYETLLAAWCGAADVGAGRGGVALLDLVEQPFHVIGSEADLAGTIVEALAVGARRSKADVAAHLPRVYRELWRLLARLTAGQSRRGTGRGLTYLVERAALEAAPATQPVILGQMARIVVRPGRPKDFELPSHVDRVIVEFVDGPTHLARYEVPAFGGLARGDVTDLAFRFMPAPDFQRFFDLRSSPWFWATAAVAGVRSSRTLAARGTLRAAFTSAGFRTAAAGQPSRIRQRATAVLAATERQLGERPTAHAAAVPDAAQAGPAEQWEAVFAEPDTCQVEHEATWRVPVLAYHRIAGDGPDALARWRVAPERFCDQIRLLRSHGYRSTSSAELWQHRIAGRPLQGRPVLITFDDGYQDFANAAWPILAAHNFTAEVFVVTDLVGKTGSWDAAFGAPAPLMDWAAITRLAGAGVVFGSHLASHTSAPNLSSEALLQEAVRSRCAIERHVGQPVQTIAAPYSAIDDRLEQILELTGYRLCYSAIPGSADIRGPAFAMPRIEVPGHWSAADLAHALGLTGAETAEIAVPEPEWISA